MKKMVFCFFALIWLFPLVSSAQTANLGREDLKPLIVIDPGHGGDDVGAKGVGGLLEKDVTLAIAREVAVILNEEGWARVKLTRNEDKKLSLKERTEFANSENADLFVSIHTNASEYKTITGVETYYLDNTDEASSLRLANLENFADATLANAQDLNFIISDLIQNAKLGESIRLAHTVQSGIAQTLGRYYEGVRDLGVKKAPFYVLVGAHMPCVLTEVSFIDHPIEGKRLGEKKYQRVVASAISQSLKAYFEKEKK